jgi:hypothetical protein
MHLVPLLAPIGLAFTQVASASTWMSSSVTAHGGNSDQYLPGMAKQGPGDGITNGDLPHQRESGTTNLGWRAKVKAIQENLSHCLDMRAAVIPLIAGVR